MRKRRQVVTMMMTTATQALGCPLVRGAVAKQVARLCGLLGNPDNHRLLRDLQEKPITNQNDVIKL